MARTSSIYDHFDLYLTPVTLTFNLPDKTFQMALLLLQDNNWLPKSLNVKKDESDLVTGKDSYNFVIKKKQKTHIFFQLNIGCLQAFLG